MRVWLCLLWWSAWIHPGVLGVASAEAVDKHILQQHRAGHVHAQGLVNGNGSPARRLLQQQPVQQAGKSGSVVVWGDLDKYLGPTPAEAFNGKVTKIAAGFFFAMALFKTREVVVWGRYNTWGQLDVPPAIQGQVVDIAAGAGHGLALLANGSVAAWGWDSYGQAEVPSELQTNTTKVTSIAASYYGSLALLADESVVVWGYNVTGEANVPTAARANVTAIAGGGSSAALLANGTALAWGNVSQWLGKPANPSPVAGLSSIAVGTDHMVGLLRNGSVAAWTPGKEFNYPNILQQVLAVPSAARSGVIAVAANENYTLALRDTGEVVAWGWAPPGSDLLGPLPPETKSNVIAIAAGFGFAMALVDGPVSLPKPPAPPPPHPPYPPAPPPFQPVAQGDSGAVVVWGDTSTVGPIPLAKVSAGIVKVSASFGLALALTDKAEVVAWSYGDSYKQTDVPAEVQGHVVDISAGLYWGMAALSNGSVVAWGANTNNQTDVPADLRPGGSAKAISVAAGYQHGLALLANNSVVAWGANQFGQTNVPLAARANVSTIAAFSSSSAAVLSDGTLVTWGFFDPLPPDIQQAGVATISLGLEHALVLLRNGSVMTWAHNLPAVYPDVMSQLLAIPPSVQNGTVVAVSAGVNVSMALLSSGQVVAWGALPPPNTITPVPDNVNASAIAIAAGGGFAVAVLGTSTPQNMSGQVNVSTSSPTSPIVPPPGLLDPSSDSQGSKVSGAALAGIVIGGIVFVALIIGGVAGVLLLTGQRRASHKQTKGLTVEASGPSSHALKGTPVWDQLTKVLIPKETFMMSVAQNYSWIVGADQEGPMYTVEAGVNDTQLDNLQQAGMPSQGVVELSKAELQDQVHLLADGLLGRGATALVFKCVWPSRFGPDSLLAIKVLKDGSDADVGAIQSFAYEAQLLAAMKHPNVVRVYGYCLEPPTVCLILELLPASLKQKLYGMPPIKQELGPQSAASAGTTNTQFHTASPLSLTQQTGWTNNSTSSIPAGSTAEGMSSRSAETDLAITITTVSSQAASSSTPPSAINNISSTLERSPTTAPGMSLLEIVRTSTDIAAGLAYLHSQEEPVIPESEEAGMITQISSPKDKRIVHRDLKPANILLNSEGAAKITDFGLARDHDDTTVAAVNMGAGTMPYMAPEQLTAARAGRAALDATNRVDIYSLGMMMWEMLAGEAPWKGKSEDMIFAVVMNHRRPPLPGEPSQDGQSLPDVPGLYDHPLLPKFTSIIRACWQQRDRKRPTAAEVHSMLATLLRDLQTHASLQSV